MRKQHIGGLEDLWLQNGYDTADGEVKWRDRDDLTRAITLELCHARHRLAPDGIRFLRRLTQRSESELDAMLGLADGTVAACEAGTTRLPEEASMRLRRAALSVVGAAGSEVVEAQTLIPARKLVFAHRDSGWYCAERSVVPALLQGAPPSS